MPFATVGNKRGQAFNLKYNRPDFSRADNYQMRLMFMYYIL